MRNTVMVATAVLIGSFGVAAAADLGPPPRAYTEPAFFQSWQGFYVGGSIGYASADFSNTDRILGFNESDSDEDVFYTGRVGYNSQRGHLVLGAELTVNGADLNGETFGGSVSDELNWYATAVGRLGYAAGPWLFYGFGGVAWGEIKVTDNITGDHDNSDNVGWTAGAGIERKLSDAISARLEYSHVDLGSDRVLNNTLDVDAQFDAVTLGVDFKFGHRDELPLK
jgi:outer membrane immunogenic protein